MAERQPAIGRGLAAILNVSSADEPLELRHVPVDLVDPNPQQPRRSLEADSLTSLADSIRVRGVLQPVLVRPLPSGRYELIAGERRWRAARMAGLDVLPALIRRQDDAASLEVALIENMVREDLNPVDEARACAALVEELGLTQEEVGLRVGRSRVAVANLLRLLDLPDEALALLERRELSEGHGRALLLNPDNAVRRRLARQAAAAGWSVRELESRARGSASEPRVRSRRSGARTNEDPAQVAAARQIEDALGEALGVDVSVQPTPSGFNAQLSFASLEDALELARRTRARGSALAGFAPH